MKYIIMIVSFYSTLSFSAAVELGDPTSSVDEKIIFNKLIKMEPVCNNRSVEGLVGEYLYEGASPFIYSIKSSKIKVDTSFNNKCRFWICCSKVYCSYLQNW